MPTKEKQQEPIKLDLPVLEGSMSDYTGETVRIPRLQVPAIRVSYKSEDDETKVAAKGEFVEFDFDTKETKPLGKKITITILHHRQSLSAYKDETSWFTPEVSMKENRMSLFMTGKDAKGKSKVQFCMTDDMKKIREAYPDLRYQRSLYVLHEGKLKNLVVYGASFGGFIDFQKSLKGASSSSVEVELSTKKEKTGTVIYYPIVFTAGEKVSMKELEPALKELSEWFKKYDDAIAAQQKERADQAAIDRGDEPSTPNLPPAQATPAHDFTAPADPSLFDEPDKVSPEEAEAALGGKPQF